MFSMTMIDKLSLTSTRRFRAHQRYADGERGVVLPIALGLGAIMSLVALIMLVRSHNDQTSVVTRDAIAKSEVVAELGINRYKSFINRYRDIGLVPLCRNDSPSGTCEAESWVNASAVYEDDTAAATKVSEEASQRLEWQNVSEDSKDGQYRLIDYTYARVPGDPDGNKGIGTLIVEGRVNQGADDAEVEAAGTATRRLRVTFPVNKIFFGLQIMCSVDSQVSNGEFELKTNIRDTTHPMNNNEFTITSACTNYYNGILPHTPPQKEANLKSSQPPSNPAFIYDKSTDYPPPPGIPITGYSLYNAALKTYFFLPPLPPEGELTQIPSTGVCTIRDKPINTSITLPADVNNTAHPLYPLCEEGAPPPGTNYTTYHLTNSSTEIFADVKSLDYTSGSRTFTIDAPGQTIRFYVEDRFNLNSPQAKMVLTPGTKAIMYFHHKTTLEGGKDVGGAIENPNSPYDLQLYQYPYIADASVNPCVLGSTCRYRDYREFLSLQGGENFRAFILSPFTRVELRGGDVTGAIWAHSFLASSTSGTGYNSAGTPITRRTYDITYIGTPWYNGFPPYDGPVIGHFNGSGISCDELEADGYKCGIQVGTNNSWEIVER
jgi:hypothetical protein